MSLTEPRKVYKPFSYPWAYDFWQDQQRVHWLPEEVPLADDLKDWETKLTEAEKNLLTHIFRFFTQSDVEVNNCYMQHYSKVFQPPELKMMLAAFSNMETIHVAAYSYLLDTLNMPETEYSAFLEYEEMNDKYEYLNAQSTDTKREIAKTLAIFSAFTEGLSLFASFAILMNFPRFNKMKGMGQIVTWSVRDETLHCAGMTKVFRTFIEENREIWDDELKGEIYQACRDVVDMEDKFIDLVFEMGPVEGLSADEVKQYIRFIANRRLTQLGLKHEYKVEDNPLRWMEDQLSAVELGNFFEARVTEYSKSSMTGDYDEAYAQTNTYVIYGQQDCRYCSESKRLLDNLGVTYNYVELTDGMKKAMYEKSNMASIPIIHLNGELLGGYEALRNSIIGI